MAGMVKLGAPSARTAPDWPRPIRPAVPNAMALARAKRLPRGALSAAVVLKTDITFSLKQDS
jgi:hypothetical protein